MTEAQNKKFRKFVRKQIVEALIGGFGFSKNDVLRMNLMRANEASTNVAEPPVKSKSGDSIGTEPPVQDKTVNKSSMGPSLEEPKEDKPKPKSKDWNELTDEVANYISLASMMVGDNEAANGVKILDKLYDEVSNKLSAAISPGLDETKKKKKK